MKIWDSATSNDLFALKGEGKGTPVTSVAFSPDGQRVASGSGDQTVKLWDGATGKELFSLKGHVGQVLSVALSPDGQRLASGDGLGTVRMWEYATGKELFSRNGHDSWVYSVAFSPDGRRLASASKDKTMKIWESATGKELFALTGHAGDVNSVAFSPDGVRIASGSDDKTVKIWESATGKDLFALEGHAGNVNTVAFSPDGQRLASGSEDATVKIWDSAAGKELFSLKGHAGEVWSVAFSPDGERLASGSWDKTVKIWDSATGRELLTLKGNAGDVNSVAFSPDGRRLAAGSFGTVTIWETSVPPEVQDRRAANQMVAGFFEQMLLRAEVVERLRTLPGMRPNRRREVLAAAQSYPENPKTLNHLAEELVKRPGRTISDYRQAVRYSEGACRLAPKNRNYLNTLGAAYYRVGNFNKALETLRPWVLINEKVYQGSRPADRAFLAMTHHQLGRAKEAQAELQRLRERMKDPRWAQDAEMQGFLREAEALLAVPKAPRGK